LAEIIGQPVDKKVISAVGLELDDRVPFIELVAGCHPPGGRLGRSQKFVGRKRGGGRRAADVKRLLQIKQEKLLGQVDGSGVELAGGFSLDDVVAHATPPKEPEPVAENRNRQVLDWLR